MQSCIGKKKGYLRSKKAQAEQRTILYVDESACYLLPLLAHTWAPCGQTPVLMERAGRDHLSLIAAIAPNGRLYLAGQDAAFTGEDTVWFINKLCSRYRKQDLLLIWDGAAIHRSQAVKDLLIHKPGRVHLERLPAYSPELNPVELLWSQLKRSLANQAFTSLEQLQEAVLKEVTQLRANRKLITAFFRKKDVAYFTS